MSDVRRAVQIDISVAFAKSASAAFQDAEAASARAKTKVAADAAAMAASIAAAAKKGGAALGKETEAGAAVAKHAQDAAAANAAKAAAAEAVAYANAAKKRSVEEGKAFDERLRMAQKAKAQFERDIADRIAQVQRETAAILKEDDKRAKAQQRADDKSSRGMVSGGNRFASSTFSTMGSLASGAMGVGRSIAGGLGVNFDLGAGVAKRAELGAMIQDVINQAKISGQDVGPNANARLTGVVDKVSDTSGLDTNRTAMVLSEMQAKSSDLQGALLVLPELGKLASAAKADMGDLGKAAGSVNQQLMNMEEFKGPANAEKRAAALMDIMRHITKQTADGSVEMADYARYVGRLASAAQNFAGPFEKNIGTLGALSQLAMRGGATSASEATGSAANLPRDLMKGKNLKNWEAAGINLFADKGKTKIRPMEEILVDYLRKFGGDKQALAKMFPSSSSARSIRGAMAVYNDAGGGEKGIAAVQAEMAKFSATISKGKVEELAKDKESGPLAAAQRFQNQLNRISGKLMTDLTPALELLAPKIIAAAEALASMLKFAAENPGAAITAAIVASITKAGLGMAVNAIFEKTLSGLAAGGGGGVGGKLGTLGKIGAGLAIASAAITIASAGIEILDSMFKKKDEGASAATDKDAALLNALSHARAVMERTKGDESAGAQGERKSALDELEKQKATLDQRVKGAEDPTSMLGALFSSKSFSQAGEEQQDAARLGENKHTGDKGLREDLKSVKAAIDSLKQGLKVEVTNMPAAGPAQDGRVGLGG